MSWRQAYNGSTSHAVVTDAVPPSPSAAWVGCSQPGLAATCRSGRKGGPAAAQASEIGPRAPILLGKQSGPQDTARMSYVTLAMSPCSWPSPSHNFLGHSDWAFTTMKGNSARSPAVMARAHRGAVPCPAACACLWAPGVCALQSSDGRLGSRLPSKWTWAICPRRPVTSRGVISEHVFLDS